jgi:hypothetical protein
MRLYDGLNYTEDKKAFEKAKKEIYTMIQG